ncbi:hypothetical protein ABBQ38_009562 [Trebouxia sp. C0009 RCD-2024]
MKNLKWLLGLPFEITVRIDTEYLQFNDAKDDLKDDALKRDAFLANVHTAVALDVCNRMRKGFERLSQDIDQQKPDTQAKISTLFKPGKDTGASPSTPAKRPAASRVTKKAQHEQQAELAQQAEQTGHAQQTEEEHKAQQSQAAAVAGRRLEEEAAILAADAAVPMVQSPGNGSLDGRTTLSARAARLQSRLNQQHTMEPASPGEARAGKRRRASMEPVLLARSEDGALKQNVEVSRPGTVSRGLLEADAEPSGKRRRRSRMCRFDQLWQQAVVDNMVIDCPVTREIRALALEQFQE